MRRGSAPRTAAPATTSGRSARPTRCTSVGCARPTPWTSTTSSCRPSTCSRRSPTRPSTTGGGSGTSSSTSTRTPTSRSTSWSRSSSGPALPDDAPAHAVPPGELCVVGDADQSIYAFRGATIRNIVEFEQDYPNARTILLEQNYRSTQTILRAANAVIARNEKRRAKNLWTDSGDGVKIVGYVADSEHDEAAFVAKQIDHLQDTEGVRPKDVAIFYRTNAQSRAFEEVLVRVGMPYKVVGGTRFYERKEIKDALAYLRVISNPADTVNLRRIINVPKRGIGERAEACIAQLAERERITFVQALGQPADAPGIATRSVTAIEAFTSLLESLSKRLGRRRPASPGSSRRSSSRAATSASCGPAPTPRTRPGSRTSPSWSRSPGSSTRSGSRPVRSSRWRTSSSGSRSSPTPTTSPPAPPGPTAASSP